MSKIPELRERIDLPDEIREAGLGAKLVFFIGSGLSKLAGYPSWNKFANMVFCELRDKGIINFSEIDQLSLLDPRKKLSIAQIIAKDRRYKLNLDKYFTGKNEDDTIYKLINDIGCPCVTTNYDDLLMPRFLESKDGSTTVPLNRVSERQKFHKELLSKPGTVIHLHGEASKPDTMVVAIEDYLKLYDDDNVKNLLGAMFRKHTILFLGYGLEEAEILEHILRKGSAKQRNDEQRMFVLQGFFESQKHLYENLYRYYEKSFGIRLLGFLRDRENFDCQKRIIEEWMQRLQIRKQTLSSKYKNMLEILSDE